MNDRSSLGQRGGVWRRGYDRTLTCLVVLVVASCPVWAGDGFTTYGDVGRIAIPAAGAILALVNDDTEGLKQLFVSAAATNASTYALKYAVNETRPDGGRYGFPSGHAAFAFAGAAFVHKRYGWHWGIPFEVAAAAVAVSRVHARRHYWRDVAASAAIAHASAYFLVERRDLSVRFLPMVGSRKPAFRIVSSVRF